MRNLEKLNLNENEFHLICDSMNEIIPNLACLNWKKNLIISILQTEVPDDLSTKWEVDIQSLHNKLTALSEIEILELVSEVESFWNINEGIYNMLGLISPSGKLNEILNKTKKHEPIIWNPEMGPLEEFFLISKCLELDLIIYVQDSEGNDKSIWATSEDDLLDCLFAFSEEYFFGRVQRIETAIQHGF